MTMTNPRPAVIDDVLGMFDDPAVLDDWASSYEPEPECGPIEAAILEECAESEYRTAAVDHFRRIARTGPFDHHDLAGLHLGLPELTALD